MLKPVIIKNKKMKKDQFELTEAHLKLLGEFYIEWLGNINYGHGSPAVNQKRPYGNSFVLGDVHEIVTGDKLKGRSLTDEETQLYKKLHIETMVALQIVLSTQKFEVGIYQLQNYYDQRSWKRINS